LRPSLRRVSIVGNRRVCLQEIRDENRREERQRIAGVKSLLAVDLGLKTGLALYGEDGKLLWYRSKNFGTTTRMKRAVHSLLSEIPDAAQLIIEGGGGIAEIWEHGAGKRGIPVRRITAEDWRKTILFGRERRTGAMAKVRASQLADAVITWSGGYPGPRPPGMMPPRPS
jgi:hypothetical protein